MTVVFNLLGILVGGIIIFLLSFLLGCGMDHNHNVSDSTQVIVIEHRYPMCEQPPFISEQEKLECVEKMNTYRVEGLSESEAKELILDEKLSGSVPVNINGSN